MKETIKTILCVTLLCNCLFTNTVYSAPIPREDSMFYYEIGGARIINAAPNPKVHSIPYPTGLELTLGYSCGKFDPKFSIAANIEEVIKGVQSLEQVLVSAVNAAIAALPMLIIQRTNPGLYDILQTALSRAKQAVDIATKSCEQMEFEISKGKNPFNEWITMSKANDWKHSMGTGGIKSSGKDIVKVKDDVESKNGKNGLTWIAGKRAGGQGQESIRVIGDAALSGFNMTNGQTVGTLSQPVFSGTKPRSAEIWKTPVEFRDWVTGVVGDVFVRTAEGSAKQAKPGYGLLPEMETNRTNLTQLLTNLVTGVTSATPSELKKVSGPTTGITRQVLESIGRLSPSEKGIVIDRLAGEIALQNVVEKSSIARRLLITGKREPNIYAAGMAHDDINEAIKSIEQEIESILYEARIQKEIVSSTIISILRYDSYKNEKALGVPTLGKTDGNRLLQGGGVAP